jgi:phosphoribosylformimino-5-aminoimidazole carboxamide ribotide isomerase
MITVIPAMDLINGHCVRLHQGDFSQKKNYSDSPINVAKKFENAGFTRLHMVDLDGAKTGCPKHLHILEDVCLNTLLQVDFSGGIKKDSDIESVFNAGAQLAAIGSIAVKEKERFRKWLQKYSTEKILLGLDVRDEKIAIKGWTEQTNIDLFEILLEMIGLGVKSVFCTDISRDGAMKGPSLELYKKILSLHPNLTLIASGGVRAPQDIKSLESIGCSGAIVGKAIYDELDSLDKWIVNLNN